VEAELRKLAQVYAIFSEHTALVRQYSSMLWSELDIGSLMEGVEGVALRLKKLRGLEDVPVFGLVQAEIAGFADSLPLMKELKSDALRSVRAGLCLQHCCLQADTAPWFMPT
jgi:dynein heavy chain